jgi:hypothetical protein
MWWWFILGVFIVFLLLSVSSWHGYRRSYYGPGSTIGLLVVLFLLLCFVIIFAGPWWGWYPWWW